MREIGELPARIEGIARQVKEDYETALKAVEDLKSRINELERRISRKQTAENVEALTRAMDCLDILTDTMISKSGEAQKRYDELSQDCKAPTPEPPELDELRVLCEKIQRLTTDLLCYSLGRVQRKTLPQS